ncbi:MAG: hypothetical protein O7G83_17380 [Proteobacteria bacterium]|nr:hypothetical protein [Pseudomonadota bacterium]
MGRVKIPLTILLLIIVTGCTSIAKGVTEAILERSDEEDTRVCHVEGPASSGLQAFMNKQDNEREGGQSARVLKVLMVHGIGHHIPGYSGRLTEILMRELKLGLREEDYKEMVLREPDVWDGPLGNLRISRYMNEARTRELLFYELSWSEITEAEKKIIEFDDSGEYTFRRTLLNGAIKKFFNSHIPDPLIFLGEARVPILASARQSFCWMTQGDWSDYAAFTDGPCDLYSGSRVRQIKEDDYAFITHSLGSRIVVDALRHFGEQALETTTPKFAEIREIFPTKSYPVYMLANQLPLLELGQKRATVRGQIARYCRSDGDLRDQRILAKLSIYAFSDPNDVLSYPIPPKFAEEYLDSRLCPKVTNIAINVAQPISLLGLGEFANPVAAHGDYDHDERVIALIAHGIGQETTADIVKERCSWLETVGD